MPYFKSNFFCISVFLLYFYFWLAPTTSGWLVGSRVARFLKFDRVSVPAKCNKYRWGRPSYCFGSQDGQGLSLKWCWFDSLWIFIRDGLLQKKIFRPLPKLPLQPPSPQFGQLGQLFWMSKILFLHVWRNKVAMMVEIIVMMMMMMIMMAK